MSSGIYVAVKDGTLSSDHLTATLLYRYAAGPSTPSVSAISVPKSILRCGLRRDPLVDPRFFAHPLFKF